MSRREQKVLDLLVDSILQLESTVERLEKELEYAQWEARFVNDQSGFRLKHLLDEFQQWRDNHPPLPPEALTEFFNLCRYWEGIGPIMSKKGENLPAFAFPMVPITDESFEFVDGWNCKRGHEFTIENTYTPPGAPNNRQCRTCRADRARMAARR